MKPILWALSLGLFLVLASTTTVLAQSEDCGDQTCICLPAVIDTELAAAPDWTTSSRA